MIELVNIESKGFYNKLRQAINAKCWDKKSSSYYKALKAEKTPYDENRKRPKNTRHNFYYRIWFDIDQYEKNYKRLGCHRNMTPPEYWRKVLEL